MMERSYLQGFTARVKEPRRFIQVIYGARQVGKTTLVLQLLKKITAKSIYETADTVIAADTKWLQTVWETARILTIFPCCQTADCWAGWKNFRALW